MSDAPPAGAEPCPIDPCPIDPWLLQRLVCPVTRAPLRWDGAALVSDAAGLAYPLRDGVPVLLPEAAVPGQ
ncbi:MAG: hypothetical protein A4S12_11665 [Proteobacteria bacterium SG_bin5]|nr:MAG: hypothetical protein A4S12_11665 [Proteobacteria bacterium SG_bin5]